MALMGDVGGVEISKNNTGIRGRGRGRDPLDPLDPDTRFWNDALFASECGKALRYSLTQCNGAN